MDIPGVALDAIRLLVLGRHNQICHLKAANIVATPLKEQSALICRSGGRELRWVAATARMWLISL